MSTLRKHLAGQQHRDSLPFIDLCSSCKEYVVSEPLWESIHIMGQCISGCDKPRVQVRNSPSNQARVGAQWLRLFESIFPISQRLPSPCKFSLSLTAMVFTNEIIKDVHDPSWILKPMFRDIDHTEIIMNSEFPLFNFGNLPAVIAQQDGTAESTRESIVSNAPVYANIARDAVLEPFSAGPRFQNLSPGTQAASNNLSFLDDPAGAVNYTWRHASGEQHPSHDPAYGTEVRHSETPELDGDCEEFDFYFDIHGTGNNSPSPHQQAIAPSQDSDAHTATDVQPRYHDNNDDSAQRDWLLFFLHHIERLTGPSHPENEDALGQRIARINAMTPEEISALSDSIMASVEQRRTTALGQEVRTPLPIATTYSGVVLMAAPDLDATASHHAVPGIEPEGLDSSRLDQPLPDPFAQVEWDDTELSDWNSCPDPTARSFFPEDLLMII
jgi:hypothetical protein